MKTINKAKIKKTFLIYLLFPNELALKIKYKILLNMEASILTLSFYIFETN